MQVPGTRSTWRQWLVIRPLVYLFRIFTILPNDVKFNGRKSVLQILKIASEICFKCVIPVAALFKFLYDSRYLFDLSQPIASTMNVGFITMLVWSVSGLVVMTLQFVWLFEGWKHEHSNNKGLTFLGVQILIF